MADDPYSKWLGLPDGPRPPKAHELLGLPAKPTDAAQIDQAAGRRMDQLDQYALSNDRATREQIQQLMNEVAKARTKLVRKVPKPKPKPKPKAATPAATDAPPQPTKPTTNGSAAKPVTQVKSPGQAPAPTPAPSLESLPFAGPSGLSDQTKSAVLFWSLITVAWAASLAAAFAVTYTIVAPETPEPIRANAVGPTDPSDQEPGAPAAGDDDAPASAPLGPTAEERAAQQAEQERLALEKQEADQRAEQERIAMEQQRQQDEMRRKQAEQQRQAALKEQEAERLAAQARAEEERLKAEQRATYFERRDRLEGYEQLGLIIEELSERNGLPVNAVAEFDGKQIIALDLRSLAHIVKRGEGATKITDLSPIAGLKLRKLNLENCHSLKTLDALKGMPLEWLYLRNCQSLEDISALKGMPIEWLVMTDVKIKDIEALRGMPLKHLVCSNARSLTTTAPLKGIAFETVSFSICTELKDITGLDSVNAAKGQVALNGTAITDLSPLGGKQIGILNLRGCNALKTLDGLQNATIEQLNITEMDNLEDISDLRKIRVTEKLSLETPKINSLTYLSNLQAKVVSIDCDQVTSLRGLEKLRNITLLDIQHMDHIPRKEVDRIKMSYEKLMIFSPYGVLR